jgi:hypothetical protein
VQAAAAATPGTPGRRSGTHHPAASSTAASVLTHAATAGVPQQRSRTWHKYARVATAAGTPPAHTAVAWKGGRAPSSGQARRNVSTPRPLAGGGKLLRLGTAVYKASRHLPALPKGDVL